MASGRAANLDMRGDYTTAGIRARPAIEIAPGGLRPVVTLPTLRCRSAARPPQTKTVGWVRLRQRRWPAPPGANSIWRLDFRRGLAILRALPLSAQGRFGPMPKGDRTCQALYS